MDEFAVHLSGIPRLNRFAPPLVFAGFSRHDAERNAWHRETVNIGLILGGNFRNACYERDHVPFRAPVPACVFLSPGPLFRQNNPSVCEKLVLIYERTVLPFFPFFCREGNWMLPFQMNAEIKILISEIAALSASVHAPGNADRLDLTAVRLLHAVAAEHSTRRTEEDPSDASLREIASYVELHYMEEILWEDLAEAYHLPMRTLYRRWNALFGCPPGETLRRKRLREASRLLSETDLPVREVASGAGFRDPFYFSRTFRAHTGCSPQKFRARKEKS